MPTSLLFLQKWLSDELEWICKSSYALQLHGLEDIDIYRKAKAAGFVILLTKDSDFPLLVRRLGAPPKVINLRVGNMKSRFLYPLFKTRIEHAVRLLIQFDEPSIEINLLP